jgi:hypothetical protein
MADGTKKPNTTFDTPVNDVMAPQGGGSTFIGNVVANIRKAIANKAPSGGLPSGATVPGWALNSPPYTPPGTLPSQEEAFEMSNPLADAKRAEKTEEIKDPNADIADAKTMDTDGVPFKTLMDNFFQGLKTDDDSNLFETIKDNADSFFRNLDVPSTIESAPDTFTSVFNADNPEDVAEVERQREENPEGTLGSGERPWWESLGTALAASAYNQGAGERALASELTGIPYEFMDPATGGVTSYDPDSHTTTTYNTSGNVVAVEQEPEYKAADEAVATATEPALDPYYDDLINYLTTYDAYGNVIDESNQGQSLLDLYGDIQKFSEQGQYDQWQRMVNDEVMRQYYAAAAEDFDSYWNKYKAMSLSPENFWQIAGTDARANEAFMKALLASSPGDFTSSYGLSTDALPYEVLLQMMAESAWKDAPGTWENNYTMDELNYLLGQLYDTSGGSYGNIQLAPVQESVVPAGWEQAQFDNSITAPVAWSQGQQTDDYGSPTANFINTIAKQYQDQPFAYKKRNG